MTQDRRAVVKSADMPDELQADAIDIATQALDRFAVFAEVAASIKKEFDKKYNPAWHCVVGSSFGYFMTHNTKHFVYISVGQLAVQLWKCG
jgi:dynein light chain LC8-type